MGYVPGPGAHEGAVPGGPVGAPVPAGGGVAAARAAVRGDAPGGPDLPGTADTAGVPTPRNRSPTRRLRLRRPDPGPRPPWLRPRPGCPRRLAHRDERGQWPASRWLAHGHTRGRRPAPAPGPGPAPASPAPAAASYSQPQAQAPAQAPAAQAGAPVPGGLDPRMLWPNILESVKNRRRFTWILLSQNAQVSGFDGTTLQLGFMNAGARDNFSSSGSEEVLKQALAGTVQRPVEDRGGRRPDAAAARRPRRPVATAGAVPPVVTEAEAEVAPAQAATAAAPRRRHPTSSPRPRHRRPRPRPQSTSGAPRPQASAPAPPPSAPEPPPIAPEDDTPEDDDPDLDESALSGHELIVRELGATVVEEVSNE